MDVCGGSFTEIYRLAELVRKLLRYLAVDSGFRGYDKRDAKAEPLTCFNLHAAFANEVGIVRPPFPGGCM